MTTLHMMPETSEKLLTLKQVIALMQSGHQDVTQLQKQYDENEHALAQATTPRELQKVNQAVDAQNQQASASFQQAIPLLVQEKVDNFSSKVQQLQQYGIESSAYQKRLDADRTQMPKVKTLQDYLAFSKQVDKNMQSLQTNLLNGQAASLIQQFHQEVDDWGNAHMYYDSFDGKSYALNGPYMTKGIGEDLDRSFNAATTSDEYQQVVIDTQSALFHLQMLETDYNDKTPYTQPTRSEEGDRHASRTSRTGQGESRKTSRNEDLPSTVRNRSQHIPQMKAFKRPVRIIFGASDSYLNAGVARRFHELFPTSDSSGEGEAKRDKNASLSPEYRTFLYRMENRSGTINASD